jgi:hypothetical protein
MKRKDQRVSGANLDWYLVDWTQTLNTITVSKWLLRTVKNYS